MLIQHVPFLCTKRVVLASASPRRSELLRGLGLKVEILPSTFDENLEHSGFANAGATSGVHRWQYLKWLEVIHWGASCLRSLTGAKNVSGSYHPGIGCNLATKKSHTATRICLGSECNGWILEYAVATATHKAIEVSQRIFEGGDGKRPDLIIAADTVVELDAQILEKPRDKEDALRMLSSLSGRNHRVYTGVALVLPSSRVTDGQPPLVRSFVEKTEVEFAELEYEAICAYVASGEPMDKAGAYGIQGIGGSFVKGIHGCYFNVMGFPVHRFSMEMDFLMKHGAMMV